MIKRYPFSSKNWLRATLFTAIAASFSLSLQAQTAPGKLWDKTYGDNNEDQVRYLQQTSDGGYIVGGYSKAGIGGDKSESAKGNFDYWILKLDANGTKTWDKIFGGTMIDFFSSLQQTSDGGYILGGESYSSISGNKTQNSKGGSDFWVIKLNANGTKTWDKTFGGSTNEGFSAIKQTADGGYILGGGSQSAVSGDKTQPSKGGFDYWVVKIDASGNKLWDKTFGGTGDDRISSLQQTADGGYILGGTSDSGIGTDKSQASYGSFDHWVIKIDANGNKVWDKTFGGTGDDRLLSLQKTSDGGYILGGISNSGIGGDKSQANLGSYDYWILKLDANGTKTWDKTIGGNNYDSLSSLYQTSDGGYILGGSSLSGISGDKTEASKGSYDFWVVKTDATGTTTWDKTIGGSEAEQLASLIQNTAGDFVLGGYSSSGIGGDKSQVSKGNKDYWIVKIGAAPTGIKDPESGHAVSIFPNPNQGKFNLQLNNVTSPEAEITISDLLGRVILQKELQAAEQHISHDLTLPAAKGIYLLQLKVDEKTIIRKIVVE